MTWNLIFHYFQSGPGFIKHLFGAFPRQARAQGQNIKPSFCNHSIKISDVFAKEFAQ